MKYVVRFEIYGKKMECKIEANSEQDAEYLLRGKIKIHKIVKEEPEIMEVFNELFKGAK